MWSKDENFLQGRTHADTKPFDDGALFSKYPDSPHKIKELTVVHTPNNIVGLQATYWIYGSKELVSGPENFGKEVAGAKTDTIKLEDNEFLIEIFGRNGDIFDHLGFRTSAGRSWEFGGSGGNPFALKVPYGKHFSGLRGGLGGHVHNLNLYVDPLPWISGFQPLNATTDQFLRGKKHPDTVNFSDEDILKEFGGAHKIQTLRVYYDDKFVFGLQADYFVYGPKKVVNGPKHLGKQMHPGVKEGVIELASDEFLVTFFGRSGDIFDNLGFETSKGKKFEFGGPGGNPFKSQAPFGKHFAVIKGGFGGHIHNLELIVEPIFQAPSTFEESEFKRGKTHADTVSFNDEAVLSKYPPSSYKIYKFTIYHDGKLIFGWRADYFVFGPNIVVEGEKHIGNQWTGAGKEEIIELGPDEYITQIFGRNGDIMDNFGFKTNKGRKFDFGGSGGNPYEAKAPSGHHFGVLAGGLGGHVHNIAFKVVPMGFIGFGEFGFDLH